jgi:hypothetical protein
MAGRVTYPGLNRILRGMKKEKIITISMHTWSWKTREKLLRLSIEMLWMRSEGDRCLLRKKLKLRRNNDEKKETQERMSD